MRERKMLPKDSEGSNRRKDVNSFSGRLRRHVVHLRRASAITNPRTTKITQITMKTGFPKIVKPENADLKSTAKEFDKLRKTSADFLVENSPKARVDLEDWEGVLWLKITDEEGRYSYVKRDEAVDLIRKVLPFVS